MFERLFRPKPQANAALQPIGETFRWAAGYFLKPHDPVTIALPVALVSPDETIESVIDCDNEGEFGISQCGQFILLRLKPGMLVSIRKHCEAVLIEEPNGDLSPKRIEVIAPKT